MLTHRERYDVPIDSPEEAEVHENIIHEAAMLAKMNHPHVLAFRGLIMSLRERPDHPGTAVRVPAYIAFELGECSLEDLLTNMRSEKRLFPLREALVVALHVASALAYFEEERIVHRDLKPANILVFFQDDGSLVFKVGDVRLARFLSERHRSPSGARLPPSAAMTNVGTPLYAAPEVASGRYSSNADVFSFGVVMVAMIALHVIPESGFIDFHSQYQLFDIRDSVRVWLGAKGLPTLSRLFSSCLEVNPRHRPSAKDTLSELQKVLVSTLEPSSSLDVGCCGLYERIPFSRL